MKCPGCGYTESKVIDSRPVTEGNSIRRRRECLACQKRFTTFEIIETVQLLVIKKNGAKEMFDKQKLLSGVLKADSIREAAEFLQGNMTLFLLPVVTSSMNYVDIIMENAVGFFVVCIVTTILTYAAVVWSVHLTIKLMKKKEDEE